MSRETGNRKESVEWDLEKFRGTVPIWLTRQTRVLGQKLAGPSRFMPLPDLATP